MISQPEQLPETLPIFPLGGVLLLPGGCLPLHIFEPRYVAMIEDAMAGAKLVGMVQPDGGHMPCGTPTVHKVGCAGQITSCTPTDDGRYYISLHGVARFAVEDELGALRGYRVVRPAWTKFVGDMQPCGLEHFERWRLMTALRRYFRQHSLSCDWSAAESCPSDKLVTTLAMICPFSLPEKQALLESPNPYERATLLLSLLELNAVDTNPQSMQ